MVLMGGGISGALVAYHLINAGVDCILVDARTIALGFGGNGITFNLIVAEILTDMITGRKNSDENIFSFERV